MQNIAKEENYFQYTALVGRSKVFLIWILKLLNKIKMSGDSLCKENISFHEDCLPIKILCTYLHVKEHMV